MGTGRQFGFWLYVLPADVAMTRPAACCWAFPPVLLQLALRPPVQKMPCAHGYKLRAAALGGSRHDC